jgi:hypothetical protein
MKYGLKLLDSSANIAKQINDQLKLQVEKVMSSAISAMREPIKGIVKSALETEPEYTSLVNGELRYNFGIADTSNVDRVIEMLVDTLEITQKTININQQGISGGLEIKMIRSGDFGGVLYSEPAQVIDQQRGYSLPWLEWLLLKGNDIIIQNYDVKFGPSPSSRTGNAIMVQSNNSWRVPPAFVGSIENNWITRALEKTENDIINTIQQSILTQI